MPKDDLNRNLFLLPNSQNSQHHQLEFRSRPYFPRGHHQYQDGLNYRTVVSSIAKRISFEQAASSLQQNLQPTLPPTVPSLFYKPAYSGSDDPNVVQDTASRYYSILLGNSRVQQRMHQPISGTSRRCSMEL
jgi:hypothetical protein